MLEGLSGTVLGFDFGERRIGVALGETMLAIAHPLVTIDTLVTDERFAAIGALLAEWTPVALVVGLPTHADGTPHNMTRLATKFANRLKARYSLPVFLVDERYTSEVAGSMLNDAGLRGRKQKPALDQVAAQTILQSWFEGVGERA
ncbi:Holliday junction resolvase RuvX [Craterilacuibacter sp.]|uniref:Holliday junction resolvase RuvX n=1 Tax=Craterilacuibacter sp. TaxID=2870909 RepID=UPI003F2CAE56